MLPGPSGKVQVRVVGPHERTLVQDVLDMYLPELAAFGGSAVERDSGGHVVYHWLDAYWDEPASRFALALEHERKLIGLCLLRDTGEAWEIAEWTIVRPCRRRGLGRQAADAVAAFAAARGRHDTLVARASLLNQPALAFWPRAGFDAVADDGATRTHVRRLDPR